MASASGQIQSRMPHFREAYREGLYDNAHLNNLSPGFCESIENNEMQPMNIEPENGDRLKQNKYWRRKSLSKYTKEIGLVQRQILDRLAQLDDEKARTTNTSNDFISSQTNVKKIYSVEEKSGMTHAQSENEIYSTRIQEGNNNLMFVCEPKTAQKACFQQIGNNNVMVNLHTSMISNRCQILDDNGKVIQLESDGEIWLEVKVRPKKLKEAPTSSSDIVNDMNIATGTSAHVQPKDDFNLSRTPTENWDYFSSAGSSADSILLYKRATIETKWRNDIPTDKYNSAESDEQLEEEKVRVYEREDAILVQMETPHGGMRLSDYSNLTECLPVQDALRHKKILNFLKSQADNFDFDVDVTNWEYNREPIYSIPKEIQPTCAVEDEDYSVVRTVNIPRTGRIKRKPTLPPRPHNPNSPVFADISEFFAKEGRSPANSPTREPDPAPLLPPRRARMPCENSDPSSPSVSLSMDEPSQQSSDERALSPENLKSPTAGNKTPVRDLPVPPPFLSRPSRSPRIPQRKIRSLPQSPWYHGNISSTISKSLLLGKPSGSFLVRDSSDNSGSHKYTLEFMDDKCVRRLMIMKNEESYHLKESDTNFESVVHLVEEAIKTGLEIRDKDSTDWRMIKITPVDKS